LVGRKKPLPGPEVSDRGVVANGAEIIVNEGAGKAVAIGQQSGQKKNFEADPDTLIPFRFAGC
jgi:hypothetical protein